MGAGREAVRRPADLNGTVMGDGGYLLCIPINGKTEDDIVREVALAAERGADMLEWCIHNWERYPDPAAAVELLGRLRGITKLPILVTSRCKRELDPAATDDITEEEKLRLLYTLADTGLAEAFDIEYLFGEALVRSVCRELHSRGRKALVSLHVKPGALDDEGVRATLRNMQDWGGDIAKLCMFNESFEQFFHFVKLVKQARDEYMDIPMVTAAARDSTGISRALGDVWGTDMIFVTSDGSRQPGIRELREFRSMIWNN